MCIRILLIGLLTLSFNLVYSQFGWEKGYIIHNYNGDSSKGYIKIPFKGLKRNKILFSSDQTKKNIYTIDDIAGFGQYQGKHYLRANHFNGKTQFEEILISGTYQLLKKGAMYSLKDNDSTFIINTDRNEKIKSRINRRYPTNIIKSKGILNYFFRDCPQRVEKINLNENSITKVFIKYLSCRNIPFQYAKEKLPRFSFNVKVGLGTDAIRLKTEYTFNHTFDRDYAPSMSVQFNTSFPRISNNIFITSGLLFSKIKMQDIKVEEISNFARNLYDRTIEFNSFRIPFGLGFQYRINRLNTYLKFGSGLFFSSNTKTSQTSEIKVFDTITFSEENTKIKDTYRGLIWISTGLEFELVKNIHLFTEFRHEQIFDSKENGPFESSVGGIRSFNSNNIQFGITLSR